MRVAAVVLLAACGGTKPVPAPSAWDADQPPMAADVKTTTMNVTGHHEVPYGGDNIGHGPYGTIRTADLWYFPAGTELVTQPSNTSVTLDKDIVVSAPTRGASIVCVVLATGRACGPRRAVKHEKTEPYGR